MSEREPFLIGLIVVGIGLTIKVVRDGLQEISELRLRITASKVTTAEFEAKTVKMEEEVREVEQGVQALRQEVLQLETKQKGLRHTGTRKGRDHAGPVDFALKVKKKDEEQRRPTKFRVDLD